ncbi:MAG: hypothetical protein LBP33_13115 [Candidatus Adiutrix sp.]|nr:hypothetical protein [Candidatus Adiutrix sp.]
MKAGYFRLSDKDGSRRTWQLDRNALIDRYFQFFAGRQWLGLGGAEKEYGGEQQSQPSRDERKQ